MRSHGRSPAIIIGAIAVVALLAGILSVSFAGDGQAQTAPPPVVEVSNTCALINGALTLTIWGQGADIPNGKYSLASGHPGWLQAPPLTPVKGYFQVPVTYTPTAVGADQINLVINAVTIASAPVFTPSGPCPTPPPTTPSTCVSPSAPGPLTVNGLSSDNGNQPLVSASWYLDYAGQGSNPPPSAFTTSDVSPAGSASAVLPANQASPGVHKITVIAQSAPPIEGSPSFEYWTYQITVCQPPPPTTTTTTTTTTTVPPTTTTTVRPTTTTAAPTTTTTVLIPPPTTAGPAPVLTINPQVVTDGDVTQVHGVGFPPNTSVILEWQPGIGIVTAQVGPDGTFTTPFLIIPNDQLGTRLVQASGFPPTVSAPLLVELGPSEPPSAEGQWIFRRG